MSSRQYNYRFKCPYCSRAYAKQALWVKHIKDCPANVCGVRTDMDLVCEVVGHDFQVEDIADGVVGGGAAHVIAIYCTRCSTEGDEEDIDGR